MDKASASGAGASRFESRPGLLCSFFLEQREEAGKEEKAWRGWVFYWPVRVFFWPGAAGQKKLFAKFFFFPAALGQAGP